MNQGVKASRAWFGLLDADDNALETESAPASYATIFIVDKSRRIIFTNIHILQPQLFCHTIPYKTKNPLTIIDEELNVSNEPVKFTRPLFTLKEEDMSEEELERMLGERYKPDAGCVTSMREGDENKKYVNNYIYVTSAKEPKT